jgi:hypothetical protein
MSTRSACIVLRYFTTAVALYLRRELRGVLRPQKRRNKHREHVVPEESSDICFLCLTDHHDELILLCDGEGCNNAAHMFCLTPPLLSVRTAASYPSGSSHTSAGTFG